MFLYFANAPDVPNPSSESEWQGSIRIVERVPKYELISSHCARRTGISILIEKGAPLPLIQKLTGHSDLKTLLKYDGTTVISLIPHLEAMTTGDPMSTHDNSSYIQGLPVYWNRTTTQDSGE